MPAGFFSSRRVRLECLQWSERAYAESLADSDIGIVPNLIPIPEEQRVKKEAAHGDYGEHHTDYLLRYKGTSNAGRIFVFAQYGIPVVADMYPSALQAIRDGETGFIARSAGGWYRGLKALAQSVELRQSMGRRLRDDLRERANIGMLNAELINFLRTLGPTMSIPPLLTVASNPILRRDQ
jgi:glycosyltransferase involved in cell wall biosynthesis